MWNWSKRGLNNDFYKMSEKNSNSLYDQNLHVAFFILVLLNGNLTFSNWNSQGWYKTSWEKFEDTKWAIRSGKSKGDRQYKSQKKQDQGTKNDLQNTTQKTKDRATGITLKTRGDLSSCSTCDTRRIALVTNPVISHKWEKDRIVITTDGTYPWLFVTQIFRNGSDQVMVATVKHSKRWYLLNHCFSSFLDNSNFLSRKSWYEPQALEYRINWDIYTPYAGAVGMLLHINGKFTMRKLKFFCRKVSFLTCS